MSGVYIKGLDMPEERTWLGLILYADGGVREFCQPNKEYHAIPVPPHGRLIEAEPIMKYIADGLNSGEFGYDQIKVLSEIQYAPTIIPAEEEREKL